jgi:predicted component of type VI protein secretion system
MAYGRLDVFWPDGMFKTFVLADATISIGRSPGNSIPLETDSISRYHMTIIYKDGEAQIADLDSANGTFVDGVRLRSNEPRPLYGGEEILIGELRLIYHLLDETPTRPITVPEEVTRRIELEEVPFYIEVEGPTQAIPPGAHISARVSITNTGSEAERFRVETSGVPKDWARIDRPDLEIAPNQSADVIINFKPRRRSDSAPGEYVITVAVAPKKKPDLRLTGTVHLQVLAYSGFGMALESNRLRSGDRFRLHLHNQGSAPLPINLLTRDLGDSLSFAIPTDHLTLAPGQRTVLQGQVKPKTSRFFGDAREHSFDLIARSGDAAAYTIAARAYLEEKPALPAWAAFVAGGLALAVLAVIIVGLVFLLQPAPPQPTINRFDVNNTRIAQGDPLVINWAVVDAAQLSLTVNGTPVNVSPQAESVQVDTSTLQGAVTVALTIANGDQQRSATQLVQVFQPVAISSFSIDPPRLTLYVAQTVNIAWEAPGATSTSITGLENFEGAELEPSYGDSASISLVGIPRGPLNLTLVALNEDGVAQQPLNVEMISPQCNAVAGDAALRASPDARAQVVATIPLGATIVVDAQDVSGQWLRVQLPGGAHGWGQRATFICASTFSVDDLYRELNVPTLAPQFTIVPTLSTGVAGTPAGLGTPAAPTASVAPTQGVTVVISTVASPTRTATPTPTQTRTPVSTPSG